MAKLSKGCLPCRQKRTKYVCHCLYRCNNVSNRNETPLRSHGLIGCDLLLPSCTQCVRKHRICTGYRKEEDIVFKNETAAVVQKTTRRRLADQRAQQLSLYNGFALQFMSPGMMIQQPSRNAAAADEAMVHFFTHYNDKVWATSDRFLGGFEYATHVIQSDLSRGGPVAEIVRACGLASLGNSSGSPELVTAARAKQIQVLQQLNRQLQDPNTTLSDSSILTCILLSTFESIICDEPLPNKPYLTHLDGAVRLLALRGAPQFTYDVGQGIWLKIRNQFIAECMRSRSPIPEYIKKSMENESHVLHEESPDFFQIVTRLCQLLYEHRIKGHVDKEMGVQLTKIKYDFEARCLLLREYVQEVRPDAESIKGECSTDKTLFFESTVTSWMFVHCCRVLIGDLFVHRARTLHAERSDSTTLAALQEAIDSQLLLSKHLEDSIEYYVDSFAANKSPARVHAGIYLTWPLSLLASLSTTSPEKLGWIARQAERISEKFGLRMAKVMAEVMVTNSRAGNWSAGENEGQEMSHWGSRTLTIRDDTSFS